MSDTETEDPRGIFADTQEQDLSEEVQNYLDVRVQARYSDRTYTNRRQTYRHYERWCAQTGSRDILKPSKTDVGDFLDEQLVAGYKKGTVENRLYDLSSLWDYLEPRVESVENPLSPTPDKSEVDIKRLRSTKSMSQIRYIEPGHYQKLLDECSKLRDEVLIRILWECGLRSYELVNLTVGQVREGMSDKQITLLTAKQYDDTERTVFYSYKLKDALERWLDEGGRKQYSTHAESEYLLIGKGSKQLNSNRPTEVISELAEEAGIQAKLGEPNAAGEQRRTVTAHACRHSYAVHRVRNGCPIVFLADLMGHSDISQSREYLKFRNEDVREADQKYRPR